MRDPYLILGVDRNADATTIKAAFRRAALKCHPDHNPDDAAAAERFRELAAAYELLSDPRARAAHAGGLKAPTAPTAGASRRSFLRPGVVVAICRTCEGMGEVTLSTGFFESIGECPACEGVGLVIDAFRTQPPRTLQGRTDRPALAAGAAPARVLPGPTAPGARSSGC